MKKPADAQRAYRARIKKRHDEIKDILERAWKRAEETDTLPHVSTMELFRIKELIGRK